MALCLLLTLRGDVKWIYNMNREIHSGLVSCLWLFYLSAKNSFKALSNWTTNDNPKIFTLGLSKALSKDFQVGRVCCTDS